MKKHTVPPLSAPMALGRYLSRAFPRIPGWRIREALRKKDVRIDGVRSGAQAPVRGGEELTLYIEDRFFEEALKVLYEDAHILAVEKPAGLPVDEDAAHVGADTMQRRLTACCPTALLAHRLDTGTGGVLLSSKDEEGREKLLSAFREHRIRKFYRCIVRGTPRPECADLHAFLLKDAEAALVRILDREASGALPIETKYRVLCTQGDLCELEVELITGRTHQIRAHMAYVGHPLLGDDKYGDRAFNRAHNVQTPRLWCVRMELDSLCFESPFPYALRH